MGRPLEELQRARLSSTAWSQGHAQYRFSKVHPGPASAGQSSPNFYGAHQETPSLLTEGFRWEPLGPVTFQGGVFPIRRVTYTLNRVVVSCGTTEELPQLHRVILT